MATPLTEASEEVESPDPLLTRRLSILSTHQSHGGGLLTASLRLPARMESDRLLYLSQGCYPLERIPRTRRRMVKVYLTATPDMMDETSAIMTQVYPKLRAVCAVEHDLDFQIAAPHWHPGVNEEVIGDEILDVCLSEMRNTERTAEIPIFITLLGTKYGWRPPPSRIVKKEFDYLLRHLRKIDINGPGVLRNFYEEDKNTDPAYVVLKLPRYLDSLFQNHAGDERDEGEPKPACEASGEMDLPMISRLLRTAARASLDAGHLKEDDALKYERSVLETEVNYGIMTSPEAKRNSFWFIRTIEDVDKHASMSKRAAWYVDMDGPMVDLVAQKRQQNLRDELIPGCIPEENIYRWELPYTTSGAFIDLENADRYLLRFVQRIAGEHRPMNFTKYVSYLDELCAKVTEQVLEVIERTEVTPADRTHDKLAQLTHELEEDWKKAEHQGAAFQGREEVLKEIKNYFERSTETALVIHGEVGVGKTTLMSKIALDLHAMVTDPATAHLNQPVIIVRSLDKAPQQTNVEDLLSSLCQQISIAYQQDPPESHDVNDLIESFQDCLQYADEERPLFLLLDGLEHISTPVIMDELDWFPEEIPHCVKMVVSAGTSEEDNLVQDLKEKISDEESFIDLGNMDEMDAFRILQKCLHDAGRGLAEKQAITVALLVQGCPHPVFLRLLSDMALLWPSYYIPDPEAPPIQPAVESIINLFIKQLEFKHGAKVVSRIFAYLCAAKRGLTEPELLDVLSLDDALLSSEGVFPRISPSPRRFPALYWLRIKWEMAMFLDQRETENRVVIGWRCEIIRHCISDRYLGSPDRRLATHRLLADYFMGSWLGKEKSFQYMERVGRETDIPRMGSENRHVLSQPLHFLSRKDSSAPKQPNRRKLVELPYHLVEGDRITDLRNQVLFNYQWLRTRISVGTVAELVEDLEDTLNTPYMQSSVELELLLEVLQDIETIVTENSHFFKPELTARLLQYLGHHPNLSRLIRLCDLDGFHDNRICPVTPFVDTCKDEVVHAQKFDTGIDGHLVLATTNQEEFVIIYTIPQRLNFLNINSADKVNFECPDNAYYTYVKQSVFREWTLAVNDGEPKHSHLEDTPVLDVYDNDSGTLRTHIAFKVNHNTRLRKIFRLADLNQRKVVFETFNHVAVFVDTIRLCNILTGEEIESDLAWPYLLTPDERFLLVANNDTEGISVREFPSCKAIGSLNMPRHVTAIIAVEIEGVLYILASSGSTGVLSLFNMEEFETDDDLPPLLTSKLFHHVERGSKGGVGKLLVSPNTQTILACVLRSKGKAINQVNYLIELTSLSAQGSYRCDLQDEANFSSDSRFLFHLRKLRQEVVIFDAMTAVELATYSLSTNIIQCLPACAGSHTLVTTSEYILEVDMETVVKREAIRKEAIRKQEEEEEELVSQSGRHSKSSQPKRKANRRAIQAEVDSSSSSLQDLEWAIPIQVLYMDNDTGLVEVETNVLHRGIHFTEFDIPSYITSSEIMLTPNGKSLLGLCDQVHIWMPQRCTVIMAIPLFDKDNYTWVYLNTESERRAFAVSGKFDMLAKDVSTEGIKMVKGAYVYRERGSRTVKLYEAKGGEVIQKIPSVVRVYDALTLEIKSIIRIQNEKVVTCNDRLLITCSRNRDFTHIYELSTGDQVITIEYSAAIAMFCLDGNTLLLISKDMRHVVRLYSGRTYLDCEKIRATKDTEMIMGVRRCSFKPNVVLLTIHILADYIKDTQARMEYALLDLVTGERLVRFEPQADIVHISANALVCVDRDFRFYDLYNEGSEMFHYKKDTSLSAHISYFTDDGQFMVFLDPQTGTLNVIDVARRDVVSQCLYHKTQSTLDRLRGRLNIVTLRPLYGGYQCIVMDGSQLKQYNITDFPCWQMLKSPTLDKDTVYGSSLARATFFHSQYKEDHMVVEMTGLLSRLNITASAEPFQIPRSRFSPIKMHTNAIAAV